MWRKYNLYNESKILFWGTESSNINRCPLGFKTRWSSFKPFFLSSKFLMPKAMKAASKVLSLKLRFSQSSTFKDMTEFKFSSSIFFSPTLSIPSEISTPVTRGTPAFAKAMVESAVPQATSKTWVSESLSLWVFIFVNSRYYFMSALQSNLLYFVTHFSVS